MGAGRAHHTATVLRSGAVLITGGARYNGAILASAELYVP